MSKKYIIVAANPIIKLNFVISTAPLRILRLISMTLDIFYELYASGIIFSNTNTFAMPHNIDNPPIVLMNTVRATVFIGANPSGVEDSNISMDLYEWYD